MFALSGMLRKVAALLRAVEEDEIGTHAKGARDRVLAASKTTLAEVNEAATK